MENLESLSLRELEKILEGEKNQIKHYRAKIKSKMVQISASMKKYDISTGPDMTIQFDQMKKAQLISKIKSARIYKNQLMKQFDTIKNVSIESALNALLLGYGNITVSKEVEMLRNIGYSESEIDIILSEIRGDETYEELKDKADTIITNHYLDEGGIEVGDDYIPPNPYAF